MTITRAPHHKTTINQDRGIHSYDKDDGLPNRMHALFDIVTTFSDYCQSSTWEGLSASDRGSWAESIADVHAARVELASLRSEHRRRAEEALAGMDSDGVSDDAAAIRRAIAETAEAE